MIGQTLGHYRIDAKLGEGGMGVVYKATDTHLDRLVAIKILPPDKTADPARKRRFVQEAKSASALNHPRISHIYDIDEAAGVDFIAMEFVPGRTLDQVTGRKGLALGDTLRYAVQIADALAAAHDAGIVHRDVKPANIMVTADGQVKLLDFGLAKLTERVEGDEFSPTRTAKPHTEEGTIVGTVAYMSPEQAEGRMVDARSDIFSFGSVLYEMVTGRRAFSGETKISTLSAILHKEPPPLEDAPPELGRIIARCLRKDPARRTQHMVDVKLALEELKEESDSGKLQAAVPRRRPRTAPWVIAGLAVALVLAAASVVWWLTSQPVPLGAPVLVQLTRDTGLTIDPALSPDGKLLACASDRSGEGNLDIYVQQVGGGAPLRHTRDPADEREPAFSPDGTTIAFRSEKDGGGIYMASTLGGPARLVAPGGRRPRFSPDGTWITYWAGTLSGNSLSIRDSAKVFVVAAAGGTPRQLAPDFVTAVLPIWSSDGSHVLFLGYRDSSPEQGLDWWVAPLEGGPAVKTGALDATRAERLSGGLQVLPLALAPGAWEPESQSVLFSARAGDTTNLWRIGISSRTWKVAGRPERVTSGPSLEDSPSLASGPGGTVRVAFASMRQNLSIWSLPIDPNEGKVTGPVRRWTNEDADDFFPALSSDGTRLVFVSTRTGHQELWVRHVETGEDVALTASRTMKYNPSFSPDGTLVAFAGAPNWDIYVMPSAGGTPKVVCDGCGQLTGWSSDGKRVLTNNSSGSVTLLDLPTGRTTKLLARPGHWLCCGRFSPDDRWVRFLDGTEFRIYVAPLRSGGVVGEKEWIDVIDGDSGPWSPDGTLVYTPSFRDGYRCIWAQRLNPTTKRPEGAPLAVFHLHNARLSIANQAEFGMSIGRNQLVFDMGERTGNIWMAEWKAR